MRIQTRRQFCHRCRAEHTFEKPALNHSLHAILTICTLGLWGISWLALVISSRCASWSCRACRLREADRKTKPLLMGSLSGSNAPASATSAPAERPRLRETDRSR